MIKYKIGKQIIEFLLKKDQLYFFANKKLNKIDTKPFLRIYRNPISGFKIYNIFFLVFLLACKCHMTCNNERTHHDWREITKRTLNDKINVSFYV